jgi:heterotetrameric sarcosine oxidase delta subunit
MLRIECPWCGVRDEPEFTYGGELQADRPAASAGDAEWAEYLFYRTNAKGEHAERWCHSFGCGQWFNVVRNTATHEIVSTYALGGRPGGPWGPRGRSP